MPAWGRLPGDGGENGGACVLLALGISSLNSLSGPGGHDKMRGRCRRRQLPQLVPERSRGLVSAVTAQREAGKRSRGPGSAAARRSERLPDKQMRQRGMCAGLQAQQSTTVCGPNKQRTRRAACWHGKLSAASCWLLDSAVHRCSWPRTTQEACTLQPWTTALQGACSAATGSDTHCDEAERSW